MTKFLDNIHAYHADNFNPTSISSTATSISSTADQNDDRGKSNLPLLSACKIHLECLGGREKLHVPTSPMR